MATIDRAEVFCASCGRDDVLVQIQLHWTGADGAQAIRAVNVVLDKDAASPKDTAWDCVSAGNCYQYQVKNATQKICPVCPRDNNTNIIHYNPLALLVPQGDVISLYTQPADALSGDWSPTDTLSLPANTLVQDSSVDISQSIHLPNQLEALARVGPGNDDSFLAAWQFTPNSGSQKFILVKDGTTGQPIQGITGAPALVQSDLSTFELLVPSNNLILHYNHTSETLLDGDWRKVGEFELPGPASSIALTQVDGLLGSLKAVFRIKDPASNDFLVAYDYDVYNDWRPSGSSSTNLGTSSHPIPVDHLADDVTGSPGLLYISSKKSSVLELLVPQGSAIVHYRSSDKAIKGNKWEAIAKLPPFQNNEENLPISVGLTRTPAKTLYAVVRVHNQQAGARDFMVAYEYTEEGVWQTPVQLTANGHPITVTNSLSDGLPNSSPPVIDDESL